MKNSTFEKGIKKRKKVLGIKYVNSAIKKTNLFNDDFQNYITKNCWDKVWNNKYLSDKQKSFNNLCILSSTNKWSEFKNMYDDLDQTKRAFDDWLKERDIKLIANNQKAAPHTGWDWSG